MKRELHPEPLSKVEPPVGGSTFGDRRFSDC